MNQLVTSLFIPKVEISTRRGVGVLQGLQQNNARLGLARSMAIGERGSASL